MQTNAIGKGPKNDQALLKVRENSPKELKTNGAAQESIQTNGSGSSTPGTVADMGKEVAVKNESTSWVSYFGAKLTSVHNAVSHFGNVTLTSTGAIAKSAVHGYLANYSDSLNVTGHLQIASDRIEKITGSAFGYQLSQVANGVIFSNIDSFIPGWLTNDKNLIGNLLGINLANGFANLIEKMDSEQKKLASFDKLEQEYEEHNEKFSVFKEKLVESHLKQGYFTDQEALQKEIDYFLGKIIQLTHSDLLSINHPEIQALLEELYPDMGKDKILAILNDEVEEDGLDLKNAEELRELIHLCQTEGKRQDEIKNKSLEEFEQKKINGENIRISEIPHYDPKDVISNILTFLCKKGSKYINGEKLQGLEEKYKEHRIEFSMIKDQIIFSKDQEKLSQMSMEDQLKFEAQRDKLINQLTQAAYEKKDLKAILTQLYPEMDIGAIQNAQSRLQGQFFDFDTSIEQDVQDLMILIPICQKEGRRQAEYKACFLGVVDELFVMLFPNKLNDIVIPRFFFLSNLAKSQAWVYDLIKGTVAGIITENYLAMENDSNMTEECREEISSRVKDVPIETLIQAPAAFAQGYARNYVKTDPSFLAQVELGINDVLGNTPNKESEGSREELHKIQDYFGVVEVNPDKAKENFSNVEFSEWVVQSAQRLLNSDVEEVHGLGNFLKNTVSTITLKLLATASENLLIEVDESDSSKKRVIPSSDFMQKISDALTAKFNSLQSGEKIPEQFVKDLIDSLPLPLLLKHYIIPIAIKKMHELEATIDMSGSQLLNDAIGKIKVYENGEKLIAFSDIISDMIIKQILTRKDKLTKEGLGESLDELLALYLPGIEVDETLRKWFTVNISALGSNNADDSHAMIALKQTIKTILLNGLANTASKNIENKEGNFSAQLFQNLHQVFISSFPGLLTGEFDLFTKSWLQRLLGFRDQIGHNQHQINKLKEKIEKEAKVYVIKDEQKALFNGYQKLYSQKHQSNKLIADLKIQSETFLIDINQELRNNGQAEWNKEDLSGVQKYLAQKIQDPNSHLNSLSEEFLSKLHKIFQSQQIIERISNEIKDIDAKLNTAKTDFKKFYGRSNSLAVKAINELEDDLKDCNDLIMENAELEFKLTAALNNPNIDSPFVKFGDQLFALFGLESPKEDLSGEKKPLKMMDHILNSVEKVKKDMLPRVFLDQMGPLLLSMLELEENKAALSLASKTPHPWGEFISKVVEGSMEKIPDRMQKLLDSKEFREKAEEKFPGGIDFYLLFEPELRAILTDKEDKTLTENRVVLGKVIESVVVKSLLRIFNANQSKKDIVTTLTSRLNKLVKENVKLNEDDIYYLCDQLVEEMLGLESSADFNELPEGAKEVVFDIIRTEARSFFKPIVAGIKAQKKQEASLDEKSGSGYLAQLAKAFSIDAIMLIPYGFMSYKSVAHDIFKELAEEEPTDDQLTVFTDFIVTLTKNASEKNVTNHAIVEAFKSVIGEKTKEETAALNIKIEAFGGKDKVKAIVFSPEAITSMLQEYLFIPDELKTLLEAGLHDLTRSDSEGYKNISELLQPYMNSILLSLFTKVAEKYPKTDSKDSFLIFMDVLLEKVQTKYALCKNLVAAYDVTVKAGGQANTIYKCKSREDLIQNLVKEATQDLIKDLFDLRSAEDLVGIPPQLQSVIYNLLNNQIGDILKDLTKDLMTVDESKEGIQDIKANLGEFGVNKETKIAFAAQLAQDVGRFVMSCVPNVMADITGTGEISGVAAVSSGIQGYFEDLSKGNVSLAKLLLQYSKKDHLKDIVGTKFKQLDADKSKEKAKIAEIIGNALLGPINSLLTQALAFEETDGLQRNQNLIVSLLGVATQHLKVLNQAKASGKTDHAGLVEEAGDFIHDGIPKTENPYKRTMEFITQALSQYGDIPAATLEKIKEEIQKYGKEVRKKNLPLDKDHIIAAIQIGMGETELNGTQIEALGLVDDATNHTLTALMRTEVDAYNAKRKSSLLEPTIKDAMKVMFPNGKNDLIFVPEALRGVVWKLFKEQLLPLILSLILDVVLSPDMIQTIVLTTLTTLRQNLEKPIFNFEQTLNFIKNAENLTEKENKALLEAIQKHGEKLSREKVEGDGFSMQEVIKSALTEDRAVAVLNKLNLGILARVMGDEVTAYTNIDNPDLPKIPDPVAGVAGDLFIQAMGLVELHPRLKAMVIDPATNEASPAIREAIGRVLIQQFNGNFIHANIGTILEAMVKRDDAGNFMLNFIPGAPKPTDAGKTAKRVENQEKIKTETYNMIDAAVLNFIRGKWAEIHRKIGKWLDKKFGTGKIGKTVHLIKKALNKLARLVFINIFGSILQFFFAPIGNWIKHRLYEHLLNDNLDAVVGAFVTVPEGQPTEDEFSLLNQNLVYQFLEKIREVIKNEVGDDEPADVVI